jgi:predicted Zn-dependent peptidase
VFNAVVGAGRTSKLFMNVRERLSLCYSIGSGYYSTKGILTVSAGIDTAKEETVRQEILAQLKNCEKGEISEAELNAAKEAILSSLRSVHDSPGAIEGYYSTAVLSGLAMTPAKYMAAVEAVTVEQVAAAAKTVQLHSSFFLEGVSQ